MKVLYFDVETTGLDSRIHDIVQFAYILEVNGKIVESEYFMMKPLFPENADPKALAVNGIEPEEFAEFLPPDVCKREWEARWSKHVDKFNPADKMWPCAFNGTFDIDFLNTFYKRLGDNYLGSWINWKLLDPLPLIRALQFKGRFPELDDLKLATIAEYFDIPLRAHDAASDVRALREIMHRLNGFFEGRSRHAGLDESSWVVPALDSYLDNCKIKGVHV